VYMGYLRSREVNSDGQDLKRGLGDKLKSPLSFVVREWMPSCPPEFVLLPILFLRLIVRNSVALSSMAN